MSYTTINSDTFGKMLLGGAAVLKEHVQELNDLNVFPVADGDTGTNMLKTLSGGIEKSLNTKSGALGSLADAFASGVLLSARGNSGVILSQIFAGITDVLKGYGEVNARVLADAYKNGVKRSYAAVQNPTEGTILTVFRESTSFAAEKITDSSDVEEFFRLHLEEAHRSLASTKERLAVLAEADVVDSGAAGYVYIAEGMYNALTGKVYEYTPMENGSGGGEDINRFTRDSVLEFGYCTEFLLRLTTAKVDPDEFDINLILNDLNELKGESIVAYKTEDIVKVHVHTMTPGAVLERAQKYGEFLTLKIENMALGHTEKPEKKAKKKPYSVVAVATGSGMADLFTEMGAEKIVDGGQSKNPSIEDFVKAFSECEGKNIIVLPNNKNVILAANEAAKIYKDATVHVVKTKDLMQGYCALAVINPGIKDIDAQVRGAESAAASVVTAEITAAVRDAKLDGKELKKGQYMALSEGRMAASASTAEEALLAFLEREDMSMFEIITVLVGKNVDEDTRADITEKIEELYPECEVIVYEGGQPIYDYLVALE